jgi:hypothetical protein
MVSAFLGVNPITRPSLKARAYCSHCPRPAAGKRAASQPAGACGGGATSGRRYCSAPGSAGSFAAWSRPGGERPPQALDAGPATAPSCRCPAAPEVAAPKTPGDLRLPAGNPLGLPILRLQTPGHFWKSASRRRWVAGNRRRISIRVIDVAGGRDREFGAAGGLYWEGGELFYGTRVGPGWYQGTARVARGCQVPFSVLRRLIEATPKRPWNHPRAPTRLPQSANKATPGANAECRVKKGKPKAEPVKGSVQEFFVILDGDDNGNGLTFPGHDFRLQQRCLHDQNVSAQRIGVNR